MDYRAILVSLLEGANVTARLCLTVLLISTVLALVLTFLRSMLTGPTGRIVTRAIESYNWFFRGVPPLIIIFLVYFGSTFLGHRFSSFTAATVALILVMTAFLNEVFRSGVQAVPRDQHEAAAALGMSRIQVYSRIALPQGLALSMPPFVSTSTQLVKDSALVSVIGVTELFYRADVAIARTHEPFLVYAGAGLFYVLINSVVLVVGAIAERRTARWLEV